MTKWPEFDSMIQLQGKPYVDARDRILGAPALSQAILQGEADVGEMDWRIAAHREILRAWAENRALAAKVQADLNAVNIALERKKVTGVTGVWTAFYFKAQREYKEPVLPFCWEVLLKFRESLPDWQVLTYLHMVSALPDPASAEPVAEFLYRAQDAGSTDQAGRILESMPRDATLRAIDRRLGAPAEAGVQDAPQRAILKRTKERILKKSGR